MRGRYISRRIDDHGFFRIGDFEFGAFYWLLMLEQRVVALLGPAYDAIRLQLFAFTRRNGLEELADLDFFRRGPRPSGISLAYRHVGSPHDRRLRSVLFDPSPQSGRHVRPDGLPFERGHRPRVHEGTLSAGRSGARVLRDERRERRIGCASSVKSRNAPGLTSKSPSICGSFSMTAFDA